MIFCFFVIFNAVDLDLEFTAFQLNLASQSVLEGLNACLDHRAEVYVPELGKTFHIQHEKTRLFACQNPLNQGGGRKGLPRSFLNRFTQVRYQNIVIIVIFKVLKRTGLNVIKSFSSSA